MLEKINNFLKNIEIKSAPAEEIVLQGPDTLRNILEHETQKLAFLEQVNSALLYQVANPKVIKKLSYKEKKELLRFLSDIQNDSRNFIINMASLCAKNSFFDEVLKLSKAPTVTVVSDNGETFESLITEERRKELTEMLRDEINTRAREQANR